MIHCEVVRFEIVEGEPDVPIGEKRFQPCTYGHRET
jgi:hypothetical protein